MRKLSGFFGFILFLAFSISPRVVYADHYEEVLGVSDSSAASTIQLPPTAEGPGLILPDSPFYFLDNLKQQVRLALAFTAQDKAKVYASIAGERMAELRIMLARNNKDAAAIALSGVSQNLAKASDSVSEAAFLGNDVKTLAKTINDDIKVKQDMLDTVIVQTPDPVVKEQFKDAATALLVAKVKTENSLSPGDLRNEIRDDLMRQANLKVIDASQSAKQLEVQLNELQQEASISGQQDLKNREEALQRAILEKNATLTFQRSKELDLEKQKQLQLFQLHQQAADAAKTTVRDSEAAAIQFQTIIQTTNQLQRVPVTFPANSAGSSAHITPIISSKSSKLFPYPAHNSSVGSGTSVKYNQH